jgi:RHS repeat-associated protein
MINGIPVLASDRGALPETLGSEERLTNTYDPIGRRTAVEDNLSTAGKISFTYDAGNRVTNVKMTVGGTLGPQVTMAYDAADRLTSLSRQDGNAFFPPPNKVLTTFTYDNDDRVLTITHTYVPGSGSSSTLATYLYTYNAASELTTEVNQDGTYTYSYDNTSQLIGVDASGGSCGASGCDESFSYDVNGNRTMSGYSTGTGNRLTSDGTHNYAYDDNGNTLTKTRISDSQKWEFTWDFRNRLTQVVVKNAGGTILQQSDFTYDAFDRRIIKSFDDDGPGPHSATVTKTIYDGPSFAANPYADFDGSNALTMRYLYGPAVDMIMARRNASGTVAWHLGDHLGSIHDVVSTSGVVIDHIRYSAFGIVAAESSPSNGDRFKYTGREYDSESALYYNRARYYEPSIGRFLGNDPIGFQAGETNLASYTSNSPLTRTDPTGLDWRDYWMHYWENYWRNSLNYLHYLTHPSHMDRDLRYGFYGSSAIAVVSGGLAAGLAIVGGTSAAAGGAVAGSSTASTTVTINGISYASRAIASYPGSVLVPSGSTIAQMGRTVWGVGAAGAQQAISRPTFHSWMTPQWAQSWNRYYQWVLESVPNDAAYYRLQLVRYYESMTTMMGM